MLLGLILVAYAALAAGYALSTPRWNNPDEPAHFNYLREVAETGRLPVIRAGDWDAELLERLKTARFPDDAAITPIRYEAHQPPLYYLLGAAVYRLAEGLPIGGQVLALRGLSILFGAIVVMAAFGVARELFPEHAEVRLLAAATAAFIPMHTAISAAINNDSLANALGGLTLLLLVRRASRDFDDRGAILLGLVLGAIVLTKVTAYPFIPLGLGVLVLCEWPAKRSASMPRSFGAARRAGLALVALAAMASWWIVRNVSIYGWTDPLAAARHAEVVAGQPRWAQVDVASVDFFGRVLFRSFWGQFGWMGVVLPDRAYLLYLALTGVAVVGLVPAIRRLLRCSPRDPERGHARRRVVRRYQLAIVVAASGSVLAGVIAYNLTFIQPQGRYLFSALAAWSPLLALGWFGAADVGRPGRSPILLQALLAGALGWLWLDAGSLLLAGRTWPVRWVAFGSTLLALAVVAAATRRWLLTPRLAAALAVGLGLLNVAYLMRDVGPAFR